MRSEGRGGGRRESSEKVEGREEVGRGWERVTVSICSCICVQIAVAVQLMQPSLNKRQLQQEMHMHKHCHAGGCTAPTWYMITVSTG